jgi:hypothetical protein
MAEVERSLVGAAASFVSTLRDLFEHGCTTLSAGSKAHRAIRGIPHTAAVVPDDGMSAPGWPRFCQLDREGTIRDRYWAPDGPEPRVGARALDLPHHRTTKSEKSEADDLAAEPSNQMDGRSQSR